jgi:PadR family transcriptional regulator, regulatory protein AphA
VSIALTPTSYLVLGCLALGGPATPYEMKASVNNSVGFFWSFPHSQLYSEPDRLARAGLLSEEREDTGRRRRVFAITDRGRAALRDWLADPSSELPEIRDIGLLKLFFGDLADSADIVRLAQTQRAAHQERLALYELVDAQRPPGAAGATIRLGIAYERAAAAFWDSIEENPPTRP